MSNDIVWAGEHGVDFFCPLTEHLYGVADAIGIAQLHLVAGPVDNVFDYVYVEVDARTLQNLILEVFENGRFLDFSDRISYGELGPNLFQLYDDSV